MWGVPRRTLVNWLSGHQTPRGLALAAITQKLDAALRGEVSEAPGQLPKRPSQNLSARLKAARKKLRLSQAQAAAEWHIPRRTLINWENNQRMPRSVALTAINTLLDGILSRPKKPRGKSGD